LDEVANPEKEKILNCCQSDHSENQISDIPDPELDMEMQSWMNNFASDLSY